MSGEILRDFTADGVADGEGGAYDEEQHELPVPHPRGRGGGDVQGLRHIAQKPTVQYSVIQ